MQTKVRIWRWLGLIICIWDGLQEAIQQTAAAASSLGTTPTPSVAAAQTSAVPRAWWATFDQNNREKMRAKLYVAQG